MVQLFDIFNTRTDLSQVHMHFAVVYSAGRPSVYFGLIRGTAPVESLHICLQSLIQFQTHPSTKSCVKSSVDWRAVIWSKATANILSRPRHLDRHGSALNCVVINKMRADWCRSSPPSAFDNNAKCTSAAVVRACTELAVLRRVVTPSARCDLSQSWRTPSCSVRRCFALSARVAD